MLRRRVGPRSGCIFKSPTNDWWGKCPRRPSSARALAKLLPSRCFLDADPVAHVAAPDKTDSRTDTLVPTLGMQCGIGFAITAIPELGVVVTSNADAGLLSVFRLQAPSTASSSTASSSSSSSSSGVGPDGAGGGGEMRAAGQGPSPTFSLLHTFGGVGADPLQFNRPSFMCVWRRGGPGCMEPGAGAGAEADTSARSPPPVPEPPNLTLLVAEWGNNRVQEVDPLVPAHVGFWFGELVNGPQAVATSAAGDMAAVSEGKENERHSVALFALPSGNLLGRLGYLTPDPMKCVRCMCVHPHGCMHDRAHIRQAVHALGRRGVVPYPARIVSTSHIVVVFALPPPSCHPGHQLPTGPMLYARQYGSSSRLGEPPHLLVQPLGDVPGGPRRHPRRGSVGPL